MKVRTKTRSAAPTKRRKPKDDDPAQYERFREAARELGTDDSPEAFDRAFGKIVPPKQP